MSNSEENKCDQLLWLLKTHWSVRLLGGQEQRSREWYRHTILPGLQAQVMPDR